MQTQPGKGVAEGTLGSASASEDSQGDVSHPRLELCSGSSP